MAHLSRVHNNRNNIFNLHSNSCSTAVKTIWTWITISSRLSPLQERLTRSSSMITTQQGVIISTQIEAALPPLCNGLAHSNRSGSPTTAKLSWMWHLCISSNCNHSSLSTSLDQFLRSTRDNSQRIVKQLAMHLKEPAWYTANLLQTPTLISSTNR